MGARGNNYQELISAALRMFETTGQLPSTPEELAEAAEIDVDKVRAIFATRSDLRRALINHGIALVSDKIRLATTSADPQDPLDQLKSLSHAFFGWGFDNAALFGLMARALSDPDIAHGSTLDMHRASILELVLRKLKEAQDIGRIPADVNLDLVAAAIHCTSLGISSMIIHRQPDPWYRGEETSLKTLAFDIMDVQLDRVFGGTERPPTRN